ncbi:phasin family protein [Janthinobacterium aquaticum]|uniref:phasin family protein n=1 Tax=Janthinobacterium sp. FT58W TaxID=2654254 RepID=UPI001263EA2C|nr:phasin family protein [Janthinobacterium sp. FT58W]KAB8040108.1 hypothetical protein GCM43_20025 [Janthinobacterium sp. FT58W]
MFLFSEQLSQAGKAVYEAQLASTRALFQAACNGGARALALQLDTARATLAAASAAGTQLWSAPNPENLLQVSRTQSQLAIERIGSYSRQAKEVAQETQEQLQSVTKGEFAASRQKIDELCQIVKKTPVPLLISLNNFLKSPFASGEEGYDKNKAPRHGD